MSRLDKLRSNLEAAGFWEQRYDEELGDWYFYSFELPFPDATCLFRVKRDNLGFFELGQKFFCEECSEADHSWANKQEFNDIELLYDVWIPAMRAIIEYTEETDDEP